MKSDHSLTGRDLSRHILPELLEFGVLSAAGPEMTKARALAAELIGPAIVSTEALDRVQQQTGCAVFVAYEDGALTGVLAFILLNAAGVEAVIRGDFDASDPAAGHMASPDEVVCGTYGWGVCATTKPTARRVIDSSLAIRPLLAYLPHFARPTTEAGHRLMRERLGFVDLPGSDGLVWTPPTAQSQPAEAA